MTPTSDFLKNAEKHIHLLLQELRPKLLEAHGNIEPHAKTDTSAVTDMDMLVEHSLREALGKLDPAIGFCGEETGFDPSQQTFWLVDPIDGTESFIRGLPFSSNMITLIDNGAPVLAIIYNFYLDDYYLAIKGGGATKNGQPITVSFRPLNRAYVVAGHGLGLDGYLGATARLRRLVQGLPQMHSSGYEFSLVACGVMDGCIAWNPEGKPWDTAPGALLVQEAGGCVANVSALGFDYLNPRLIAASPVIFDDLMRFVKDETIPLTPKSPAVSA